MILNLKLFQLLTIIAPTMYKLIALFVLIGVLHQAQSYRIYDDRDIDLGDTLAQLSAKCVIAQMEKMPTIIGCIKNEVEKLEAMVNKESDVKLINKDACCGLPTLNSCFTVIKVNSKKNH